MEEETELSMEQAFEIILQKMCEIEQEVIEMRYEVEEFRGALDILLQKELGKN